MLIAYQRDEGWRRSEIRRPDESNDRGRTGRRDVARRRYRPPLNIVEADGGCRRLVFIFDQQRLLTIHGADE